MATLQCDHKESLSEKMHTLLVRILPTNLQERIVEQLDRLTTYRDVPDKIMSLAQSSAKYAVSDAMDCRYSQDE